MQTVLTVVLIVLALWLVGSSLIVMFALRSNRSPK